MTGGVLAIAPVTIANEGMPVVPDAGTGASSLAALVTIGLGLTSATFIAMYSILPAVGATNLSLVTFVAPVSATLIGVSVLGDVLGAPHLGGMAPILSGLLAIDGRLIRALTHRQPRAVHTVTIAALSPENLS